MSKVKNISGGPLDVPLLDRVVEDGETVDVPDVQGDGISPIIWPENRWQPVAAPKIAAEGKRSAPPPAPVVADAIPEPGPPDQTAPAPAPASSDPRFT